MDHNARTNTRATRTVLVVVHTVTAMNRFEDVLGVFDSDRRIQLVFTFPDASAVTGDIDRALLEHGALVMHWADAVRMRFDLAISSHHSGNLHELDAPLVLLSHGIGYTKLEAGSRKPEAGSRKPEAGSRKPEAGNRKPETGNRETYGLGPSWLHRGGKVFAEALVLSHKEQLNQLAGATPDMVDRAVVAGDPCFDRMRASTHARGAYRRALGASDSATVVVVSSTWGPNSLFGQRPDLLTELIAELTVDDHVPVAVLHPNLWFAHGPLQVRYWLGEALRSGLRLVPPFRGWQQAVLAADVVIGDHGAVTGYAAACGFPVLLATFPKADVAPKSAIDALGRTAPRIDHHQPLLPQVRRAIENHDNTLNAEVAELASSVPDQAADLLRSLFYRIIGLSEPDRSPLLVPYAAAELLPEQRPVQAMWVSGQLLADDVVQLIRWPSDVSARRGRGPRAVETHLVVDSVHPRRDLRGNAAVVVLTAPGHDLDAELARVLLERPASELAVAPDTSGRCRLRHREGGLATTQTDSRADAATIASAIHTWLTHRGPWGSLPPTLNVQLGQHTFTVGIRRD